MQFDIPEYFKYIILFLGAASAAFGIIRRIIKHFSDPKSTISILIGIILILIFVLLMWVFECKYPKLTITSPSNNGIVVSPITIRGNANCFPSEYKIAVLIHRKKQHTELEKWFIHPECGSLENKDEWKVPDIEIGTDNMNNFEFEIYAYAIRDTMCHIISKITQDPTYTGTFKKPDEINGVHDWIRITRKSQ